MTRFNIYDAGIKVHPEALTKRFTTVIVLWYQSKHTEPFNEGNLLWYGIYLSGSHIQQNVDFRDPDAFELVYNVKCLYNLPLTLSNKRFLYVNLFIFFIQGLFKTARFL